MTAALPRDYERRDGTSGQRELLGCLGKEGRPPCRSYVDTEGAQASTS